MKPTGNVLFLGFSWHNIRNRRPLSLTFFSILLASFTLLTLPPAAARTEANLQLSAISGPTGTMLTIRGYVPQGTAGCSIGGLYIRGPQLFSLNFGAAAIRQDGSFLWYGPLPRAGVGLYADTAGRSDPTFVVPKGQIEIHFGSLQGSCVGADATFEVTDNKDGPYVNSPEMEVPSMQILWNRTDSLVNDGTVKRSWLWGPLDQGAGVISFLEPYREAPNGWRTVTYYDKARMEVTKASNVLPNPDPYYITNGLLVREMVTGQVQVGDNTFVSKPAAKIYAAGDLASNNSTPTFADYAPLQSRNDNSNGKTINQFFDQGMVTTSSSYDTYGVTAVSLVKDTNHYIASPFWTYLNSQGLVKDNQGRTAQGLIFDPIFYATGLPITEGYWTKTWVGGEPKDVLVQLFERRVLTYTPSNPAGFQVEMGNVGLEYFQWRYGDVRKESGR